MYEINFVGWVWFVTKYILVTFDFKIVYFEGRW